MTAWFLPQPEAVVVTSTRPDGTLCIVDVAAPELPTMAEILGALDAAPTRLDVHFPPDRLDWTGCAAPAETQTELMVRGDPGRLAPFMFPETAAF